MLVSETPKTATKISRLEARINPEILGLVKKAAEMEGRSVSDFVVSAAREAAYKSIEQHSVIRLSLSDQQKFVELLLNPPPLSHSIEKARVAHKELFGE